MSSALSIGDILSKVSGYEESHKHYLPEEWVKMQVDWYNNTEGHLNEKDGYNCQKCKNRGFVAFVNNNVEVHKPCKCLTIRDTLNRAKKSGLGEIITEYTFDKYICTEKWQEEIKAKAQEFCKDENAKWFFIGGQSGAGKTHICTAISAYYIKQSQNVLYMLWGEEAKRLKSLVSDYMYQSAISIYKNVDVLYIDDFLKVKSGESPTSADINLAFEIINHRIIAKKTTIISSEKRLDEIINYDEATMSRIFQAAGNYKISIEKDRHKNYRLFGGNSAK